MTRKSQVEPTTTNNNNNNNTMNSNKGSYLDNLMKTVDTPNLDKIVIYTGNCMKSTNINSFRKTRNKNNQELVASLEDTVKAHLYKQSPWTFDKVHKVLEIPDPFNFNQRLTEDRNDYDITAKLFYLPSSSTSITEPSTPPPQYITQSIYHLFKLLGINTIDTFIVSFNGLSLDDSNEVSNQINGPFSRVNDRDDEVNHFAKSDDDGLIKVWEELEKIYKSNRIDKLGVSEFTKSRLEDFIRTVNIPPKVDQINVTDCRIMPKRIIEFAKQNDIELLTHSDSSDILPSTTFQKILEAVNTDKFVLNKELLPRWVLKYSVMIKCRGVVANKGYIVMGSKPNSDLKFTYSIDEIIKSGD